MNNGKSSNRFGSKKRKQKTHRHQQVKHGLLYANDMDDTYYGYVTKLQGNRRVNVKMLIGSTIQTIIATIPKTFKKRFMSISVGDYVLINNNANVNLIGMKYSLTDLEQLVNERKIDRTLFEGCVTAQQIREFTKKKGRKLVYANSENNTYYAQVKQLMKNRDVLLHIKEMKLDDVDTTYFTDNGEKLYRASCGSHNLKVNDIVIVRNISKKMFHVDHQYTINDIVKLDKEKIISNKIFTYDISEFEDEEEDESDEEEDESETEEKDTEKEDEAQLIKNSTRLYKNDRQNARDRKNMFDDLFGEL